MPFFSLILIVNNLRNAFKIRDKRALRRYPIASNMYYESYFWCCLFYIPSVFFLTERSLLTKKKTRKVFSVTSLKSIITHLIYLTMLLEHLYWEYLIKCSQNIRRYKYYKLTGEHKLFWKPNQ